MVVVEAPAEVAVAVGGRPVVQASSKELGCDIEIVQVGFNGKMWWFLKRRSSLSRRTADAKAVPGSVNQVSTSCQWFINVH